MQVFGKNYSWVLSRQFRDEAIVMVVTRQMTRIKARVLIKVKTMAMARFMGREIGMVWTGQKLGLGSGQC